MHRLVFILAALVACDPAADKPLGGRSVAVSIDCREPQQGWVRQQVESFGWHVSDAGEVTVRCGESDSTGEYALGTNEVIVGQRAVGLFAVRATTGHELGHWLIDHGPHPALARLHVCSWAYNDPVPRGCFPDVAAKNAMMSPADPDAPEHDWFKEVYTGAIPEYRITPADQALFDKALRP